MNKFLKAFLWLGKIVLGSAIFGLGFSMFLEPNGANAGGLSGLAMILVHLVGFGTVGVVTGIVNLPLLVIGGMKINREFMIGSVIGMVAISASIDLCMLLPPLVTEPLIGAIFGGVFCGLGLGIVFSTGASTGGSDILVRLLKMKWPNVPIGIINTGFDLAVVILTGIVFGDLSKTLYSAVAVFICGRVIDAVVYRFDYSKVAIIISPCYEQIAKAIGDELDRGSTFLHGEGAYSHKDTKVILTAVKRQQLSELKELVVGIDPDAFIIVQEAHQVLGDGFARYSKDAL